VGGRQAGRVEGGEGLPPVDAHAAQRSIAVLEGHPLGCGLGAWGPGIPPPARKRT
jgi:hypothetical protein